MLTDFDTTLVRTRQKYITVIETFMITVIGSIMCYFINHHDPLFIDGPFPFGVLAPFLISLLYGLSYGVVSYLLALFLAIILGQEITFEFQYYLYVFSTALMLLILGQFGSYWKKKMAHIEHFNNYLFTRIDKLTRAYYFIKISHDSMEEQFITNPVSLRNTFNTIQKLLETTNGELTKDILSRAIYAIAKYFDIQQAQFHFADDNGDIIADPEFVLGERLNIDVVNDSLVKYTQNNKETGFINPNDFDDAYESVFIISAPLLSSENNVIGYLLIREISFRSLNVHSVEKLTIFLSYLANIKEACQKSKQIRDIYPDCPLRFSNEVSILGDLKKQNNVDSVFVKIVIPDNHLSQFYIENLKQIKRNTDYVWVKKLANQFAFIIFMPLDSQDKVYFFIDRIKKFFLETYEIDIIKDGFSFYYLSMLTEGALETIDRVLNNSKVKNVNES